MKVLFVINGLSTGGAEHSLAELLPLYQRAGVEPLVVCLDRRSGGIQGDVITGGFDVRFLEGSHLWSKVAGLRRLVRAERPDLVHTVLFEADVAGRLATWRTGALVVTSLVNTSYDAVRLQDPRVHPLKLRAVKLVDGWTARHLTAHFHAITETVKRSCVAEMGIDPARVTVIERGRDATRLGRAGPERRRQARERLGLSPDDEVVLNVGRQEFQKGHRVLVEALPELAHRPRLVVLQAGPRGHVSAELAATVARLGVGDRVRFLGDRTDVPDLLAAADVFVFPSLYEGLGGSLIEAMALELPVVASDIPTFREILDPGGNALLFEPGNPVGLARALEKILDDPELARAFGRRSREIFEERFLLEESAARSVELYRDLLAGAGPRPAGVPAGEPGTGAPAA